MEKFRKENRVSTFWQNCSIGRLAKLFVILRREGAQHSVVFISHSKRRAESTLETGENHRLSTPNEEQSPHWKQVKITD